MYPLTMFLYFAFLWLTAGQGGDKSPQVDCDSKPAQNCKNCQEVSDECKNSCEDDMDSDDCAVCKLCRECTLFTECEYDIKEPECPGESFDECFECEDCMECWVDNLLWGRNPNFVHEDCPEDGKCYGEGKCASCETFVNDCMVDRFCEANTNHSCMDCQSCLGCFSEEKRGFLPCIKCQDCQICRGFVPCFTEGLEVCIPEKVGPLFMKNRVENDSNGFVTNMNTCLEEVMVNKDTNCDCLLSIPIHEMEENNCFLFDKSLGDMRALCDVDVISCEDYECDKEHMFIDAPGSEKSVSCPYDGKDWFSKDFGPLAEGSLMAFCQDRGYHGLDAWVYTAKKEDPMSLTNKKDWTCNHNMPDSDYSEYPYVKPGGDDSRRRVTFRCREGKEEEVQCCQQFTAWKVKCVLNRTAMNNFEQCGKDDSCTPKCEDPSSVECFNCCNELMADHWNCPDSAAPTRTPSELPSRTPTASPSSTDAPSRTPTASPSRNPTASPSSTDAPSRTPTASPSSTDAPSRTPTASPSRTPTASPYSTDAPSRTPTASPSGPPTASPSGPPTASPSGPPTASPSGPPTASPVDATTPNPTTPSPTEFTKVQAELICVSAKTKKDCKKALTKAQGKCKFKSGKKGKLGCKLKSFNAPVNCETLKKRECKTAISKGKCVAADPKGTTCKSKAD